MKTKRQTRSIVFSIWTLTCALVLAMAATAAQASDLSRKWVEHLWITDYTDVHVSVFHLPNETMRVRGRFSNGMRTVDRTISVVVLAETADGAVHQMVINERVPMSGGGGTQVRWKEQDIHVPGEIVKVYAKGSVVGGGQTFGVKLKCNDIDGGDCKVLPDYKEKADKLIKTSKQLKEVAAVNICAGFNSAVRTNYAAQTAHWKSCSPYSGAITEHQKVLTRPVFAEGQTRLH